MLTRVTRILAAAHTDLLVNQFDTTGLSTLFNFFDIRALWGSGLSARVPECQKI